MSSGGACKSVATESGWYKNELKFNKFTYRMIIDNFSDRTDKLTSNTFSVGDDQDTKWCLELRPDTTNGYDRRDYKYKRYLSVYVAIVQCKKTARAKYKFSIVGENGCEDFRASNIHSFSLPNEPRHGRKQFIEHDFLLNEKNGLLPNDTLTVVCELYVLVDTVVTCGQSPVNVDECHLSSDFAQLLHSEDLSDCTLNVVGNEFKVHKAILAARSPVFAAMFKHGMKEAQGERIDLNDIEPEVMQEMINYIYTGYVPKLNEMAIQLLGAADKYQLDQLKNMCENAMYGGITAENACFIRPISSRHTPFVASMQMLTKW